VSNRTNTYPKMYREQLLSRWFNVTRFGQTNSSHLQQRAQTAAKKHNKQYIQLSHTLALQQTPG